MNIEEFAKSMKNRIDNFKKEVDEFPELYGDQSEDQWLGDFFDSIKHEFDEEPDHE